MLHVLAQILGAEEEAGVLRLSRGGLAGGRTRDAVVHGKNKRRADHEGVRRMRENLTRDLH